jgi:alkylation response protein AidB-like acyl-CoA dehydrogenase
MADFEDALDRIRSTAAARDQSGEWPADELGWLAETGAMRWALPKPFGDELSSLDLHLRYEQLAAASLAVALAFSQRDSAVQLIEASDTFPHREPWLRDFAAHRRFATIGIAQLTTSRQGGAPALRAEADGDGFLIDGVIPWSTGAAKSDVIVAGAATIDRRQVLFCLPTDHPGVTIDPPLPLVALRATWTAAVHCDRVKIDRSLLLRGPTDHALAGRRKGVPFGQVFFALGLCRAAVDLLSQHRSETGQRSARAFNEELKQLRDRVLYLSSPAGAEEAPAAAADTRAAVNDFAVRVTHAAVALYKGTALLADHPAQRLAREAMFLLVWSCPGAVIDCTLERLMEC